MMEKKKIFYMDKNDQKSHVCSPNHGQHGGNRENNSVSIKTILSLE